MKRPGRPIPAHSYLKGPGGHSFSLHLNLWGGGRGSARRQADSKTDSREETYSRRRRRRGRRRGGRKEIQTVRQQYERIRTKEESQSS